MLKEKSVPCRDVYTFFPKRSTAHHIWSCLLKFRIVNIISRQLHVLTRIIQEQRDFVLCFYVLESYLFFLDRVELSLA